MTVPHTLPNTLLDSVKYDAYLFTYKYRSLNVGNSNGIRPTLIITARFKDLEYSNFGIAEVYPAAYAPEECLALFNRFTTSIVPPFCKEAGLGAAVYTACSLAAWDLQQKDLYQLNNHPISNSKQKTYISLGSKALTSGQIITQIKTAQQKGHTRFKIRLPSTELNTAVNSIHSAARCAGPHNLAVDFIANSINSPEAALNYLPYIDESELMWIEEPAAHNCMHFLDPKTLNTPILFGEWSTTVAELQYYTKYTGNTQFDWSLIHDFVQIQSIINNANLVAIHSWGSKIFNGYARVLSSYLVHDNLFVEQSDIDSELNDHIYTSAAGCGVSIDLDWLKSQKFIPGYEWNPNR